MIALALAAVAFVGTHFLMSHPLRSEMVSRIGEPGFRGFYSLVSLLTFAAMIWAYRELGDQVPLWPAADALWVAAAIVMWFASILLAGSLVGNPALPGARAAKSPRGVLAITRHPMMWSFALWAIVHAAVIATPKALLFDGAILFLALAGSVGQDSKKRRLMGARWHEWTAQTAFVPFARGVANPGLVALVGGTLFFLLATWLHPLPVAPWRWIGMAG
ncbi:MFS transporter [Sphingomonas sinipercae]|uniref:MFS transporter n=1 Tax=Sphingomonas sinipercae TaxID=2714944 RepID=A0A6G7ZNG7_9SPHN|nr:NnrU family protein [Sphingomonas sinipercae]QIL02450.1 MFS transporter [Sphingomonas sinipercae]